MSTKIVPKSFKTVSPDFSSIILAGRSTDFMAKKRVLEVISRLLYSQADLELLIFWTKRGVLHTTENNTHFVMKTWSIYNRAYRKK